MTRAGRLDLVFEMDPDSNGFSVEIYLNEAGPDMECMGRIDLFSESLIPEGGAAIPIPAFVKASGRTAVEDWANELLAKRPRRK